MTRMGAVVGTAIVVVLVLALVFRVPKIRQIVTGS